MRELFREFVVAKRREEEAHLRRLSQAWHIADLCIAAFHGKLPSMSSLIAKSQQASARVYDMTPEQVASLKVSWSNVMGIKPRPISDAALKAYRRFGES